MRIAADTNSTANQAALGRRLAVSLSLAGRMKLLFLRPRWRGNQDSPCALYFHGSRHFPALKQRSELRDGVTCLAANKLYPEVQRQHYKSILGIDIRDMLEQMSST